MKRYRKAWFFGACLVVGSCSWVAEGSDGFPPAIRIEGSPTTGSKTASVTIVEFTDFECHYCGAVQPTLRQVLQQYPNQARLVFKNYPLRFHRNAKRAHLAAMCADEQGKFWEYRNHLFQNQRALQKSDLLRYAEVFGLDIDSFQNCLEEEKYMSKIQDDFKEGLSLGVTGTPAFFINGRLLPGAQPFPVFQAVIEDELKGAG